MRRRHRPTAGWCRRARIGRGKPRHRAQPLDVTIRQAGAAGLAEQRRPQEQLADQPVIGHRRLEIDPVGEDLLFDFVLQSSPADVLPATGISDVAEKMAGHHQASKIRGVVVAVDIGLLDVPEREVAVEIEAGEKLCAKVLITPEGLLAKTWKSHVQVKRRIAASIVHDQFTV